MTDAQKFSFYLPVWQRVLKRHHWNQAKKLGTTLAAMLDVAEESFRTWPDPAGPLALQVIYFARQIAMVQRRQATAEDLRRACTIVATGKQSSKHLNNTEVNRLVTLLRLLIDPDDLDAVTNWLHPEEAHKRGLVDFIRKLAPEGLLVTIYRNAYGTQHWEDGNRQQLIWLLKQVKGRTKAFHAPVENKPEMDPELVPF